VVVVAVGDSVVGIFVVVVGVTELLSCFVASVFFVVVVLVGDSVMDAVVVFCFSGCSITL
jgi:hypothetical protein